MTINTEEGISITVVETGNIDGVRTIKGYSLEIPNGQPNIY